MNSAFKIIFCICFLNSFKTVVAQNFNLLYDKLDDVLFNGKPDEINEEIRILSLDNNNLSTTKKAIVNFK